MPVRPFLSLLTFAIAALIGHAARGQTPPPDLAFSILTFGPGPAVYERFGHIAIRVRAPSRGIDASFDWGNFSFDDPKFLWHFTRGENRYWMQGKDTTLDMLDEYLARHDRTVIEQRLSLDEGQRRLLFQALLQQDSDASRYYVYDYYRDNCATRVRDSIDAAVGGQLRPQLNAMTPHGYRWETRRLLWSGWDNKLIATLIDFCEGPRADRPLNEWDDAFLPMRLAASLDRATIADDDGGTRRPLVSERIVLNATRTAGNDEPAAPGAIVAWPLAIGVGAAALLVVLARLAWPLAVVGIVAWESIATFGGAFFAFAIACTRHWIVAWNLNFLQFTPIGVLVIASILARRWRRTRHRAATLAAGLSLLGGLISIAHVTQQQSGPAVALALPLHVGVWYAVRTRAIRNRLPLPSIEGSPR